MERILLALNIYLWLALQLRKAQALLLHKNGDQSFHLEQKEKKDDVSKTSWADFTKEAGGWPLNYSNANLKLFALLF